MYHVVIRVRPGWHGDIWNRVQDELCVMIARKTGDSFDTVKAHTTYRIWHRDSLFGVSFEEYVATYDRPIRPAILAYMAEIESDEVR